MPLSGRARQNTDTKRYKTQQNLHRIQRQCHYQEERDKTHVTNLYILQNTKTLASHPTTMPSSGRARAAARLLAPVKTPMSSTWKVSLTTFYDYHNHFVKTPISSTWKVSFATYTYYQQLIINWCDALVKNDVLFDLFRIEAANEQSVQVDALGSCHHSAPAFLVLHFLDDS